MYVFMVYVYLKSYIRNFMLIQKTIFYYTLWSNINIDRKCLIHASIVQCMTDCNNTYSFSFLKHMKFWKGIDQIYHTLFGTVSVQNMPYQNNYPAYSREVTISTYCKAFKSNFSWNPFFLVPIFFHVSLVSNSMINTDYWCII